jgi:hypothetical protein
MKSRYLLALVATAGCADFGPRDELSAARKRWEAHAASSYDMTVMRACECLPGAIGPVIVHVRNGHVVPLTPEDANPGFGSLFPDVPGLFDQISEAIAEGHLGSVEYDFTTGYPRRFVLDYDGPKTVGADGEILVTAKLVLR